MDYSLAKIFSSRRSSMSLSLTSKHPPNRLITRRRSDVEISRLVESMRAGNLTDRAQLEEFEGLDRELLIDINALLDALTNPLKVLADTLGRIARGEVPPQISESYAGELERLRNDLNRCISLLSIQVS
jgi:methyl-accepting chemotaxis protein